MHLARFSMKSRAGSVRVPKGEGLYPGATVAVTLAGSAPREGPGGVVDETLPPRPASAQGSVYVALPPLGRRLSVRAAAREATIEPKSGAWRWSQSW